MTVYYIAWICTSFIGLAINYSDYLPNRELTIHGVEHTIQAKSLYILLSVILVLFAGCRYYVGTDFGAYYRYERYLDFWQSLKSIDEPGIRLIYSIAIRIHDSGQFCIFSVAAVTLGLELWVIYKNTDQIGIAIILFCFICWTACFNGVRQALAIAVLFCGFPALRDRDFKRYLIFAFLAFLCHRSAIMMILISFMTSRKTNYGNVFLLLIVSLFLLYSYDRVFQVVNVVLDNSVTGEEAYWSTQVNRLRPIIRIVQAGFFLYVYRNEEKTNTVSFYLNILLVSAVISIVTMNSAALARMSMYMGPFTVIAIVELLKIFPDSNRKIITFLIVILYWIVEYVECYGVIFTLDRLRWFW